jgi:type VI secretion system FHA domain protein
MALRLTIMSNNARRLGERATKEFGPQGGTIGRSLQSDWVLPDGQRYVSSRHASIDFRSGSYYLVDTSTNGVFVNGSEQPVGRGKPQRLFNGDRIRIGAYEIGVEVDDGDETPLNDEHIDPVDLAQRVDEPEATSYDLVDAYEITGVGIEELLTEEEADAMTAPFKLDDVELELVEEPPPRKAQGPRRGAAPEAPSAPRAPSAAKPSHPKAASGSHSTATSAALPARAATQRTPGLSAAREQQAHALDAFFRGAGVTPQRLDGRQAEAVLLRLGQLVRELILGVSESLHLRAEQKASLHLADTTIEPRNDNPLKFSAGLEEALTRLLFRQSQHEYMPPADAVREAYTDIKVHQQALLKALRTALDAYARRLDPDELEQKFSRGRGVLMGAANKLKYWDLYKDLYQIVAHHPPGELPAQFLEDFARAYEEESDRASAHQAGDQAQAG